MTESDKQRFKIAMHMYELTFNAEFDNGKLAGYFMALQDIPIENIESAVKESIKSEKRTPVPATIREYADKYRRQAEPAPRIEQFSYRDIKPNSEFAAACVNNINALFDGKISKEEYLRTAINLTDSIGEDSTELEFQLNGGCPF